VLSKFCTRIVSRASLVRENWGENKESTGLIHRTLLMQGGGLSATIAELVEGDFVSQLTVPEPPPPEPERPPPAVPTSASPQADQPKEDEPQAMEESGQAGGSAAGATEPPAAEATSEMAVEQETGTAVFSATPPEGGSPTEGGASEGMALETGARGNQPSTLPAQPAGTETRPVEEPGDVQMAEGEQGRDAPDASDGGSTMGESLRSLDVEIGSRDGNEDMHGGEHRDQAPQGESLFGGIASAARLLFWWSAMFQVPRR
jgi:hypothetical protein